MVVVMARAVVNLFSGTEHPEVISNPVAIAQETTRAANNAVGDGFRMVGALAAYSFYVALIVSALTVPRARRKRT